jgi:hypothetical protein
MSEELKKFLVGLASDPARMARFAANPSLELEGTALSTAEKQVLLSRDSARLRRALGASPIDHMTKGRNGGKKNGGKKNGGKKKGGKEDSRKKQGRKK